MARRTAEAQGAKVRAFLLRNGEGWVWLCVVTSATEMRVVDHWLEKWA